VTTEYPVEKLAREAIIVPIPEGTTQIQQLIIGRALTGIAAF
jgi:alkylation response protein AidB-like acyl-CoA dehydrogenase